MDPARGTCTVGFSKYCAHFSNFRPVRLHTSYLHLGRSREAAPSTALDLRLDLTELHFTAWQAGRPGSCRSISPQLSFGRFLGWADSRTPMHLSLRAQCAFRSGAVRQVGGAWCILAMHAVCQRALTEPMASSRSFSPEPGRWSLRPVSSS
jgi:hypothetical protein